MFRKLVNVASADALVEEPDPPPDTSRNVPTSTPTAHKIKPPLRPRFNNKPYQKRRGGAAYQKTPVRTSLQIVPRERVYPVFTSNLGCATLSSITYNVMRGKDFRLANNISELQLQYVLTLSYCNRVVQTAIRNCYAFPAGASYLKQVCTGIYLPDILAKYIEAIGTVSLLSGATIVPYAGNYRDMFPEGSDLVLDPATILQDAEREIPAGEWPIDEAWIIAYNSATTRASRSGMNFRTVTNADYEGRVEMAVSYTEVGDLTAPGAPQIMSEAEAQLGACYRFRNRDNLPRWLGANTELLFDSFTAIPFNHRVTFSDVCVASFSGAKTVAE